MDAAGDLGEKEWERRAIGGQMLLMYANPRVVLSARYKRAETALASLCIHLGHLLISELHDGGAKGLEFDIRDKSLAS